jgi:nitroreductase
MQLTEILRKRRMVRAYLPDPVAPGSIERIVRAGRRAPSGGFSQGQDFVVITDADVRRRVAEALDEESYVSQGGTPWISSAPLHVIVTVNEGRYHERYQQPDKLAITGGVEITWPVPYWFIDAGAAMMLLLLAAIDEGLAAGFAGHPDQTARLGELLGLPEGIVPIGVVTIGKEADDPARPSSSAFTRRRRPWDETVHWQRWGGAPERAQA